VLTQMELQRVLDYDPETGIFKYLVRRGKNVIGAIAGTVSLGYTVIKVNGGQYKAHRLAWLYVKGEFPKAQLDHINGAGDDNRICNLRECTDGQNKLNRRIFKNNTLKIKGVSKRRKKFTAQAQVNKKYYYLGIYDTAEEAGEVYQEFVKKHHGEFCNGK